MPQFVAVCAVDEIPEGQGRVFQAAGREIALFRVGGQFYALDNICPHRGGPLGEGIVWGTEVTCPWHAWSFDLRTGAYTFDPELAVEKFEVRVEDGQVQVAV
ncbi:MAG: nitrite reductase small subunit NirD [Acidobacteria bacterium]|nr:MAG: nitrite reductase small subunit NirD [Acidobacteriota bacterium]